MNFHSFTHRALTVPLTQTAYADRCLLLSGATRRTTGADGCAEADVQIIFSQNFMPYSFDPKTIKLQQLRCSKAVNVKLILHTYFLILSGPDQ